MGVAAGLKAARLSVLAVVAHADDEALGPGGTLAKHVDAGDEVLVLALGDSGRRVELEASAGVLGARVMVGSLPGTRAGQAFDTVPFGTVIREVEAQARSQWDVCYLHNPLDLNLDHRLASRATLTAFRACGRPSPTLLAFETVSSTEWAPEPFAPNWFVALDDALLARKGAALSCYAGELRPPPHPRNPDGVYQHARVRGAQCGVHLAEAFRLVRRLA